MRPILLMLAIGFCVASPTLLARPQAMPTAAAAVSGSRPATAHPASAIGRTMAAFTSLLRDAGQRPARGPQPASADTGTTVAIGGVTNSTLQATATVPAWQGDARDNTKAVATDAKATP